MARIFISYSGLDLSFMHAPAGNVHPRTQKAPQKRRRPKAKASAVVIDFNRVRAARIEAKKRAKVAGKIKVHEDASAKVKRLAKELGIKVEAKSKKKPRLGRGWKQPARKPH
jgi:hypothetical protein